MSENISRRELIRTATLAAGLGSLGGVWSDARTKLSRSPNEKLNIACIGVGGQGRGDLRNVGSENIVALCDVDSSRAADSFKQYPDVPKFDDYRRMFDKMANQFDAVTVSTPDHHHAIATSLALHHGKHVYCQKPLTHSVSEARRITELAAKSKVATQMGTQGHAFEGYFRLVELVQSGAIGSVRRVHVWTDRPKGWWPQGVTRPTDSPPVPATLNWDLWLGPTATRPYNPAYLPFVWRGWWDFGTGSLGDMACHLMDPVFWSLKLSYPTRVSARGEGMTADSPPTAAVIDYEFPAREELPPVTVTWYDAGVKPAELDPTAPKVDNGSLFVGDNGQLLINHGDNPILLPKEKFANYTPPTPFLKRSPEHHQQWIDACKTGSPTGSNFGYAGPMTEAILLGNVSLRVGKPITYDARHAHAIDCPEAERFISTHYRNGYKV